MRGADVCDRPHPGVLQEVGERAKLPDALADGAIGEATMLAKKHAVGVHGGLEPWAERPRDEAGDASTHMSLLVGLKQEARGGANHPLPTGTAVGQTLGEVRLHLGGVDACRKRLSSRIEREGQPQPLAQVLRKDRLTIAEGHQGPGDVINTRFVRRRSIALDVVGRCGASGVIAGKHEVPPS